ncbi:hypothetical protein [Pseudoalteromonas sp.]|uniref:hypothetical protein n=1 Tax=Pseudoalteromonas sp. TaxID=53249 RepID=UPI0035692517
MKQHIKNITITLILFSAFPTLGITLNNQTTIEKTLPKIEAKQNKFTITLCPNFPICKKDDKEEESKSKDKK